MNKPKVLLISGNTREYIDQIRFITKENLIKTKSINSGLQDLGYQVFNLKVNKISSKDLLKQSTQFIKENNIDIAVSLIKTTNFKALKIEKKKLKIKDKNKKKKKKPNNHFTLKLQKNINYIEQLILKNPKIKIYGYQENNKIKRSGKIPLKIIKAINKQKKITRNYQRIVKKYRNNNFENINILITSGPTVEKISKYGDIISNFSTGNQGYEIAKEFIKSGARVTLISGSTSITTPEHKNLKVIFIKTAIEMKRKVFENLKTDIFISVAAVADFRPKNLIKVNDKNLTMIENPDILNLVANHKTLKPKLVVGFCAETHNLLKSAKDKLKRKNLDLICANYVGNKIKKRKTTKNSVFIISKNDEIIKTDEINKSKVSKILKNEIYKLLN